MRWWMVLLVIVLAGCGTSRPAPQTASGAAVSSSPVVGPQWRLTLIGTDERWRGERPAYIELIPENGHLRLVGSDGCNRLSGTAMLGEGQRIDIRGLASTRRACAGTPQAAEVGAMLSRAYRYLIDHNLLVLFGPDSRVLGGFRRQ